MVDFIMKPISLIEGLPITKGGMTLENASPEAITAVMPAEGNLLAVKKALGGWPDVGGSTASSKGRLIWTGLDQAFLFGRVDIVSAACVEITDGWVFLSLSGDARLKVLERLVPVDLRFASLGDVFRTQLGHVIAIIIVGDEAVEIGVMSSFAHTATHEIVSVMESFA